MEREPPVKKCRQPLEAEARLLLAASRVRGTSVLQELQSYNHKKLNSDNNLRLLCVLNILHRFGAVHMTHSKFPYLISSDILVPYCVLHKYCCHLFTHFTQYVFPEHL